LPVVQPTKLGLTVPPKLLGIADKVIEQRAVYAALHVSAHDPNPTLLTAN
jgi:hypothetical protein